MAPIPLARIPGLREEEAHYLTRLGERATEADAHLWLGKIAAERGDREATDREFRIALDQIGRLGLTERLVRANGFAAQPPTYDPSRASSADSRP